MKGLMDCAVALCVICGNSVFMCELDCPDQAHHDGAELSGGKGWVCSEVCWEAAVGRD
jgi:hypothetical protein